MKHIIPIILQLIASYYSNPIEEEKEITYNDQVMVLEYPNFNSNIEYCTIKNGKFYTDFNPLVYLNKKSKWENREDSINVFNPNIDIFSLIKRKEFGK